LFVQFGSNAVSHKLTHYAETIGLNKFLHRCADIADGIPNSGCLNAAIERLLRNFEQVAQLRSEQSIYRNGNRRVTVIAIEDNAATAPHLVNFRCRPTNNRHAQPPSAASARWLSINRTICRVTSSTGRSPLTETRRPLHS